jgi:membrane-associated phospholipid phosphatase
MSSPPAPLAPFRPAAVLLAAYLAATTVPLLRGGVTPGLLGAQLALLLATAWALTARHHRPGARALAAWLPLLAVPACYAALPTVAAGLGRLTRHDARVIGWEHALFGTSPVLALSAHWPARALSELLHAGYLSYYLLIYAPPAWLWWRATRPTAQSALRSATPDVDAFAAAVFTVWLTFACCYAVFAWFPVQGPWYEWAAPSTIPDGPVRRTVHALLHAGSSRGTAFPSSHVAVSVAHTLALARVAPPLAPPAAVATALLAAGAVYGGFHYGVDVLAGALVGLALGVIGPRLHARLTTR